MRILLLSGTVIVALAAAASNAAALNNNDQYCLLIHGNATAARCIYETLGACQLATNSGEGTCVENPYSRWSRSPSRRPWY